MDSPFNPKSFSYISDATFLIDILKSQQYLKEGRSIEEINNVTKFFDLISKLDLYIYVPTPIITEIISYLYYSQKLSPKEIKRKLKIITNTLRLEILDYSQKILFDFIRDELRFFNQAGKKCHCGELCLLGYEHSEFCIFISSDQGFLKGYSRGFRIDPRIYDKGYGFRIQNATGEIFHI